MKNKNTKNIIENLECIKKEKIEQKEYFEEASNTIEDTELVEGASICVRGLEDSIELLDAAIQCVKDINRIRSERADAIRVANEQEQDKLKAKENIEQIKKFIDSKLNEADYKPDGIITLKLAMMQIKDYLDEIYEDLTTFYLDEVSIATMVKDAVERN